MSHHRNSPAPKRAAPAKPSSGLRALAAALARLAGAAPNAPEGAPQPGSAWERSAEQRLTIIEKQLSNQNRLLLLTFVSIVADVLIGAAK